METINGIEMNKVEEGTKVSYEELQKRCTALVTLVNKQNEQIDELQQAVYQTRLQILVQVAGNKSFPEYMRKPMQKEIMYALYPELFEEKKSEEKEEQEEVNLTNKESK